MKRRDIDLERRYKQAYTNLSDPVRIINIAEIYALAKHLVEEEGVDIVIKREILFDNGKENPEVIRIEMLNTYGEKKSERWQFRHHTSNYKDIASWMRANL